MNVLDIVNGDDIPTALVLAPIIALLSLVSKKDGRSPRIYIYIGFTDDLTSVRVNDNKKGGEKGLIFEQNYHHIKNL
jgi:hypothetical protein